MARRQQAEEEAFGSDSFLDVVANMVGIMIILVLIAGMNAGNEPIEGASAGLSGGKPGAAASEEMLAAQQLQQEVLQLAENTEAVKMQAAVRYQERAAIAFEVARLTKAIDEHRGALSATQQGEFDLERGVAASKAEVDRLNRALAAEQNSVRAPAQVVSYPTPLAKTVTGKEVHFQLSGGRIAYVPFDELLTRLRGEVRRHIDRLRDDYEVSDTLGPIDGFRMHYTLERDETYVRVQQVDFIPVSSSIGETLEAALAPNSEFWHALETGRPRSITVTLWTYPDSFALFRAVKEQLYRRGYQVAGRPMIEEMPIGASPQGSRSAAQ